VDGWIRLYRKALDSPEFAKAELWRVFSWCLLTAAHRQHPLSLRTGRGNTLVELKPGQLIFGRNSAARKLNMAPSTLDRCMKRLEKLGSIRIKPGTHFSIITVCNWARYQDPAGKSEQATNRQRTGNGQATGTYKNGEKGKNGQEGREPETGRDDHARASWKEEENGNVFVWLGKVADALKVAPCEWPPKNRQWIGKTCYLVATGKMTERPLDSGLEAIRKHTGPLKTRPGFLYTTLKEKQPAFERLLAQTPPPPESLWEAFGRYGASIAREPSNREERDEPTNPL